MDSYQATWTRGDWLALLLPITTSCLTVGPPAVYFTLRAERSALEFALTERADQKAPGRTSNESADAAFTPDAPSAGFTLDGQRRKSERVKSPPSAHNAEHADAAARATPGPDIAGPSVSMSAGFDPTVRESLRPEALDVTPAGDPDREAGPDRTADKPMPGKKVETPRLGAHPALTPILDKVIDPAVDEEEPLTFPPEKRPEVSSEPAAWSSTPGTTEPIAGMDARQD